MRRGLSILAVFILMAVSAEDAHALRFGTRDSVQRLQDISVRGPNGEALSLGYVTTTHSFLLPYKMTGDYVLVVRGQAKDLNGRARDVFHKLTNEKIGQMQRAGVLPRVSEGLPPLDLREEQTPFEFEQSRDRMSFTVSRIVRDRI